MIIDVFKDKVFFKDLEKYNKDIEEVCSHYTYAENGEEYDLKAGKVSNWFDPEKRREIPTSEYYPRSRALQYHKKFNLIIHYYNYISLYVISKLYGDRKDILIEDHAGGMGRLFFFLSKLGFTFFHNIDNFTQICKSFFDDLMIAGNISCRLNDLSLEPTVVNLSALPMFLRSNFPESVELICCYYHDGIIRKNEEEYEIKFLSGSFHKIKGFKFLCKDSDNLTYFFCKEDKYQEFKEKLSGLEIKEPFLERIPQYEPLFENGEDVKVFEYMKSGAWLTEFKKTEELENRIKDFLEVKHCIMTSNGTMSLVLALLAAGVKPGDRVAIPNLTMIATINAVKLVGACPYLVDVEPDTLCLDAKLIDNFLDKKIRAVIYVSLNGRWNTNGTWASLKERLKSNNIPVIEDAAQSFGSKNYRGVIGVDADISSFSFSMPKIITMGQGGCLTTDDDSLAVNIRRLKDFGRDSGGNDNHPYFGINSKITDVQAVIGLAQMENIEYRIRKKKEIFDLYKTNLPDLNLFIPTDMRITTPWFVDVYFDREETRDKIQAHLKSKGIGTRPVYPPINRQGSCKGLSNIAYPVSEQFSNRGLWLPSSLNLTDAAIKKVCEVIKEVL